MREINITKNQKTVNDIAGEIKYEITTTGTSPYDWNYIYNLTLEEMKELKTKINDLHL